MHYLILTFSKSQSIIKDLKFHVQVICRRLTNCNKICNVYDVKLCKLSHLLICSIFCSRVMTVAPIWTLSVCSKCKKWSLCSTKRTGRKRNVKDSNNNLSKSLSFKNQINSWSFLLKFWQWKAYNKYFYRFRQF